MNNLPVRAGARAGMRSKRRYHPSPPHALML